MQTMSGTGVSRYFRNINKVIGQLTKDIQQLLSIWNRAKGKERDALLWGDEVSQKSFNRA
jgi:hypothetical protein